MIKWLNKKRNRKGFTLVELVVVIAILGVLSAIAVPRFAGTLNNAKEKAHAANVRTIESAINMYLAENPDAKLEELNIGTLVDGGYLNDNPDYPLGDGKYEIVDGDVEPGIDNEDTEQENDDDEI